jgi:hypothetical protein
MAKTNVVLSFSYTNLLEIKVGTIVDNLPFHNQTPLSKASLSMEKGKLK